MLVTILLAAVVQDSVEPVELYRQWKANDKFEYSVTARLQVEERNYMQPVYMPETNKYAYKFTLEVAEVSSAGFATAIYKKPTITVTVPETAEKRAYDEIEEVNEHLELSISPVNAVTDFKDLTPKDEKDDGDGDGDGWPTFKLLAYRAPEQSRVAQQISSVFSNLISEFYRLANFSGSVDTMLDFSPRLSLFEVEPGDTWEHTASYQPQPLEGKPDKMTPQRIDYTMTYVGVVEVDGEKVHRVTSDLNFDTDAAPFINSLLRMTTAQSGLRGFKMNLTAHIDFDLDLETKHTIRAMATSKGHLAIEVTDYKDRAYQEIKVSGRTILSRVTEAGS